MPDATRKGPAPTARETNAPTTVAGMPPSSDQAAAFGRASPARTYGRAANMAAGIVAGSGEATASNPGTPSNDKTGVATEDPPTPKRPRSNPMPSPATTMIGQGAMPAHLRVHTRRPNRERARGTSTDSAGCQPKAAA